MAKKRQSKSLDKIKTGKWQRQWSVAKAGMVASTGTATQMLGSAFLQKDKRQQKNKQILSQQAQYLAQELGKLKGSIVKVGQLMALYGEHVLPLEVTEALRSLEEQTLSLSWSAIEPSMKEQLGDAFDDFIIEEQPIGAASLAQVHKAYHKSSNQQMCLKLQYPLVAEAIDADIDSIVNLLSLLRLVKVDHGFNEWVEEMRQLLHLEVDYHRESQLTQLFYERLQQHDCYQVPQVFAHYCTSTLLVNSFEAGFSVTSEKVACLSQARRNRLGRAFLQLFIDELFRWGEIQTDPNFGNYRIFIDENAAAKDKLVLLDFGAVLKYDDNFLQPVKDMLLGAYHGDDKRVLDGAIALKIMHPELPEEVHADFIQLCCLLIEPFVHVGRQIPEHAVNSKGEYRWADSGLPKRAAKHAATSAMSRHFVVPPKEFAFLSRKLLGVYSFIAALGAEFNPDNMLDEFK